MDEIVARAMARWPDVPAVYGWLRLDRRGRWLVKGEPITHRPTVEFIGRNYLRDARGRHFFQNGPQRVFVDLDHCPFVLSIAGGRGHGTSAPALVTHTGEPVRAAAQAWLDAAEGVAIAFERGVGSVLDRDLPELVEAFRTAQGRPLDPADWERALAGELDSLRLRLDSGDVPVTRLPADTLARLGDFVPSPRPDPGEDACT